MAPKRKAAAQPQAPASKKAKINHPPSTSLDIYVMGENSGGELGLGTAKNTKPVKRPRLHPLLGKTAVQVACGGMHAVALTHGKSSSSSRKHSANRIWQLDNKILTWGVNDSGALGRDTTWEGGVRDMDADEDDSDSEEGDDNGLNPHEATPTEVDWSKTALPPNTTFTQVAAGDSCSFVVTDDGSVYGWGTFRDNSGVFGFSKPGDQVFRPILVKGLKDIVSIACSANTAFAINKTGSAYSWGAGERNQLGRRVIARTIKGSLTPTMFMKGTAKNKGFATIHPGEDHVFAIGKQGEVYAWGSNNFCNTGIDDHYVGKDDATIANPTLIPSFQGKDIVDITGGRHHSIATTRSGDCLTWGRLDSHQLGISTEALEKLPKKEMMRDDRGKPRIVIEPQKVTNIKGRVVRVAAAGDQSFAVTEDGEAYSWGFNDNYQCGQGETDGDIDEATLLANTAVKGKKIIMAGSGGQFSVLMGI